MKNTDTMVKTVVTNKSAAGLRRSAIAERIRLREEWSSLKGVDDENEPPMKLKRKQTAVNKNFFNIKGVNKITSQNMKKINITSLEDKENSQPTSDALRGVVALVDVGAESRALALRAALTALGATVVPAWSHLVTHLVWSQGGCRDTRARARTLACKVVSPLWVEACAASARRVSERVFPSTARASDLPSPATLCRLLKRAEKENWALSQLGFDNEEESRRARLRISSDTDENRTDGETSRESLDVESRVNTAPRRALPTSISPPPANPKSRRKLFTARAEAEDDSDAENTPVLIAKSKTRSGKAPTNPQKPTRLENVPERQRKIKKFNLTQEQRRNMENAKRMARYLAKPAQERRERTQTQQRSGEVQTQRRKRSNMPRIVLSGMPKSQYQAVLTAIETLKGKVQKRVNHWTTHVLLGTCKEDCNGNSNMRINQNNKRNDGGVSTKEQSAYCNHCNSPEGLLSRLFQEDNVEVTTHCTNRSSNDKDMTVVCNCKNNGDNNLVASDKVIGDVDCDVTIICDGIINDKRLRTLKTLLGAARGCRVLHAQWALDSLKEIKWIPHIGYEVTHLLKISQKARVERSAIDKMHAEYGYNVFRGMQVCVSDTAIQRDPAIQLLTLCGADLVDEAHARDHNRNIQHTGNLQSLSKTTQNVGQTQNGGLNQYTGRTQNGGLTQNDVDISENCEIVIVGKGDDDVSSKWVFDSVAAARPRTTRRYINKNIVTLQM